MPGKLAVVPLLLAAKLLATGAVVRAATYTVGPGPGYDYDQISDVEDLVVGGDVVLVYGNQVYQPALFPPAPEDEPTSHLPVVVRGIRVNGLRPVLEGGFNTIEIQRDHFVLEGFEIRRGTFRCVYHHSDDLTLRDLYVHDCESHGILTSDEDSGSLTVEYTEVSRSGNGGGEHGLYVTSDQNRFPNAVFRLRHSYIHDMNGGNALKSRARRNEIQYNWFEGTLYHLMELIGPDDDAVDPPDIREDSDVVGNVLVHKAYDPPLMPWGTDPPAIDGNFSFVRIGSDVLCEDGDFNSTHGRYRFVNNTFIRNGSQSGSGGNVFRPFGYLQSVEMSNNVVWSDLAGAIPIFRFNGIGTEACWTNGEQIAGQNNWVETGTASIPAGWSGTLNGAAPNFANPAGFDFRPTATSPFLQQGTSTPTGPPLYPYPNPHWPLTHEPPLRAVLPGSPAPARIPTGAIDLGAFEFPGSLFTDGFEIQSTSRWSAVDP